MADNLDSPQQPGGRPPGAGRDGELTVPAAASSPAAIRYAQDTSVWEAWQLEYRYGAFYLFPPGGVIEAIEELRRTHDPRSYAICQAHISLSEPVPRPLTDLDLRQLEAVLGAVDPFVIRYGPLTSFPPYPGVVYAIQPERQFRALRSAVHSTSIFDGIELRRAHVPPHMTIAEFISLERTDELLRQLAGSAPEGEFTCDRVEYAVPDGNFRFRRVLAIPLRYARPGLRQTGRATSGSGTDEAKRAASERRSKAPRPEGGIGRPVGR